jgi:hypothetical protein
MAFQPKDNECGLFINTRNDKSDLDGVIAVECPACSNVSAFSVSGWHKVSANGLKSIKLVLKPKRRSAPAEADI